MTFPPAAASRDAPAAGTSPLAGLDWAAVQAALKEHVGEDDYTTWLAHLTPSRMGQDGLTLSVPTSFMQSWIENNFKDVLATTVAAEVGTTLPVRLTVAPPYAKTPEGRPGVAGVVRPGQLAAVLAGAVQGQPVTAPAGATNTDEAAGAESAAWMQGQRLDPRYTFETFVTGKSNQFAYAAARRVAQTCCNGEEGKLPEFNPFFVHGKVGLGKTHLMHAIGSELLAGKPNARVLYLSSEQFFTRFVRALKDRNTLGFKELFRTVDVLMVDDIQFIAGKESTQEEFFHSFNTLVGAGKQVILSADRSPHELTNIEDRLQSRLGAGLTVEVHPPEVETRLAILQKKAEDLQLPLAPEVLETLAATIASNVRELEGALNRLVAASRLMGREIDMDFAREQLADLFRLHTRVMTIDDIQKTVADYFKIRVADMHSARRAREVARPRQVAMYLCKQLTTRSYPDIGRAFGGKDHTTVMHGVQAIDNLMERDPELADHVRLLLKMLGGRG